MLKWPEAFDVIDEQGIIGAHQLATLSQAMADIRHHPSGMYIWQSGSKFSFSGFFDLPHCEATSAPEVLEDEETP